MQVIERICDSRSCAHGCTPETGCQGHESRLRAPRRFQEAAENLVRLADASGLVLTIEQRALQPLRMGHYETVVSVRPKRGAH